MDEKLEVRIKAADAAMFASPRPVRPLADTANGADGISDIEGKAARGSSERVRATSEFQWSRRDASDIDGLSREAEWSFWEKRHRRQSRQGSSERVGKERVSKERERVSQSVRWRI